MSTTTAREGLWGLIEGKLGVYEPRHASPIAKKKPAAKAKKKAVAKKKAAARRR